MGMKLRALSIALLLATGLRAAGDFTFNVTASGSGDNWVRVPDDSAFHLLVQGTISQWVRTSVAGGVTQYSIVRASPAAANWRLSCTGSYLFDATGGAWTVGSGIEGCSDGVEDHVSGTFVIPTLAQINVAGIAIGTDTSVVTPPDPAVGPRIGGRSVTTNDIIDPASDHRGVIDVTRIFDRSLSFAERQKEACRQCKHRPVAGLIGNWAMRGPPGTNFGTNVIDWSITQAHGDGSDGTDPTYAESFLRGVR